MSTHHSGRAGKQVAENHTGANRDTATVSGRGGLQDSECCCFAAGDGASEEGARAVDAAEVVRELFREPDRVDSGGYFVINLR